MEPIFTCEYTGKSGLNFFQALESEQTESQKTQAAFPDVLKPRVLRACHFREFFVFFQSLLTLVFLSSRSCSVSPFSFLPPFLPLLFECVHITVVARICTRRRTTSLSLLYIALHHACYIISISLRNSLN